MERDAHTSRSTSTQTTQHLPICIGSDPTERPTVPRTRGMQQQTDLTTIPTGRNVVKTCDYATPWPTKISVLTVFGGIVGLRGSSERTEGETPRVNIQAPEQHQAPNRKGLLACGGCRRPDLLSGGPQRALLADLEVVVWSFSGALVNRGFNEWSEERIVSRQGFERVVRSLSV
jgi:hypothetical protein